MNANLDGVEPVRLLNATGKPVHVEVSGRLVLLPEADEPILLQFHSDKDSVPFPVVVDGLESAGSAGLRFMPTVKEIGVLHCPVRQDGVFYLVSEMVVAQFPDRDDFVLPALWGWPDKRSRKKYGARSVLLAVTRTPYAVASGKTVQITETDMPSLHVEAVKAAGAKVPKRVMKETKRRG